MHILREERGFSLVEQLITVGILGILTAVAIVNFVGFTSHGESEAKDTELKHIQTAVIAMMVDNQISTLPNPITTPTNDMSAFPDATSLAGSPDKKTDLNGNVYILAGRNPDKNGYVLFGHDMIGGDGQTNLVNYVATRYTSGTYITDDSGKVTQLTTGYE
ncbi:MAG: type II secretion system protein [Chloroflexota bacterium]|nr:MAG: type II secretion system protein [Chloroflexota bacterium]